MAAPERCGWPSLRDALSTFVLAEHGTQGSAHIRPLHWYVACRLVIEGGFHPDDVTPRPPFVVERRGGALLLKYDPATGGAGERTLLGGLKTKAVDVVVTRNGIGPCLAVSLKGIVNAFRNLTNRMEEAVGDCTNLHLTYPALVYGYFHVLRGNRQGPLRPPAPDALQPDPAGNVKMADVALFDTGEVVDGILRYHDALCGLADRKGTRNTVTRYEAIAVVLSDPDRAGEMLPNYPPTNSPLRFELFFEKLYAAYDERFVFAAPAIAKTTARLEWSPDSPLARDERMAEYTPRFAAE